MKLGAVFLGLDGGTWLSVGIGSAVTLAVALVIYFLQKTPKTLDYAEYDVQPLGTGDEEVHPGLRLDVTWTDSSEGEEAAKSRTLEHARVQHYRVQNTGKRAIRADDFQTPITITARDCRFVDGSVRATSRPGVCPLGKFQPPVLGEGALLVTPALLNPGDWIDLSVLVDGSTAQLDISTWIVDESREMRRRDFLLGPPLREIFLQAFLDSSFLGKAGVALPAAAVVAWLISIIQSLLS